MISARPDAVAASDRPDNPMIAGLIYVWNTGSKADSEMIRLGYPVAVILVARVSWVRPLQPMAILRQDSLSRFRELHADVSCTPQSGRLPIDAGVIISGNRLD